MAIPDPQIPGTHYAVASPSNPQNVPDRETIHGEATKCGATPFMGTP